MYSYSVGFLETLSKSLKVNSKSYPREVICFSDSLSFALNFLMMLLPSSCCLDKRSPVERES